MVFEFFAIISTATLLAGWWLFIRASEAFYWFGVPVSIVTIYPILSYLIIGFWGKDFDYEEHLTILANHSTYHPTVDVYLPCCGEPFSVLRNTWIYISRLDYPTRLLKVHVLDDGASPTLKKMAEEFGFNYIVRPDRPVLKKAGNMRNAFKQTYGEFIVVFDADFCPRPEFLKEILPYFNHDHRIAITQTPQFFKVRSNQTWVEQGAGEVQEFFYRLIQTKRDRFGGAICVGTCAVYRRSSLEPFGGTAPIEHSEDVHTGFQVVKNGWKIKYIPICLAEGMCPNAVQPFFTQQYRWAMGSMTLFANIDFWKSPLTVMQKICYLTGMLYYITTAIQIIINPLPLESSPEIQFSIFR
jgi:cellulose synthase/poly-beta-1,6-N-acetylglucosamine synthase-like glycosyltransferase